MKPRKPRCGRRPLPKSPSVHRRPSHHCYNRLLCLYDTKQGRHNCSSMPIFQDDLGGGRERPPEEVSSSTSSPSPLSNTDLRRKASEESIRTDLCEGLILNSPVRQAGSPLESADAFVFAFSSKIDRVELIQRLKRGDSPSWLADRNVGLSKLEVYP